jgi:ABC-2 type transport system permease protein
MRDVLTLLRPRFLAMKNRMASGQQRDRMLARLCYGLVGFVFWAGLFALFYRVLKYFKNVEVFGDLLAFKLLAMALIAFFSLLMFSGILTALSKFYLSRDLPLVHSLPVPSEKIFLARWLETSVDSSWMVIAYSLPLFLAYGVVYKAGVLFYTTLFLNILPFCLIATTFSILLVLAFAPILPAGRMRSLSFVLGVLIFLLLLISFRLMRPEKFVNPESFATLLVYFKDMEMANEPCLPTTWFFDSIRAALSGAVGKTFFHTALSWSFCGSLIYLATWVSGPLYLKGLSRTQMVQGKRPGFSVLRRLPWLGPLQWLPGPVRAFALKDIKTFLRDQTQWPQIFLLAALIVLYLYNFSVLPLEKAPAQIVYLQNLFSFLNMGLAAFVLTAVSARFVFPAISIEGGAFWIVKSAPLSAGSYLRIKFFIYFVPLFLLSELLITATNVLLRVTPFMMTLSVTTMLFLSPGVVALALCLGTLYPDFSSENPAQTVTSLGGLIYMTLCSGFIASVIALEAGPVYTIFMVGLRGVSLSMAQWIWLVGSFSAAVILCVMAFAIPMRIAIRSLDEKLGG